MQLSSGVPLFSCLLCQGAKELSEPGLSQARSCESFPFWLRGRSDMWKRWKPDHDSFGEVLVSFNGI